MDRLIVKEEGLSESSVGGPGVEESCIDGSAKKKKGKKRGAVRW